jgi:hypothetical protein
LDALNNALKECDIEQLRQEFKRLYRAIIDGALTDPFAQMNMAAAIVTCDLRSEVLKEKEAELESQLIEARKPLKQLSHKLE